MSKMYQSSELAHVWAHAQSDESGRCRACISFEGNRFYSFATTIGLRLVTPGGRTIFVLDHASYNRRTSKHQSRLRQAMPDPGSVFGVDIGGIGRGLNYTTEPQQVLNVLKDMARRTAKSADEKQQRFKYPLYAQAESLLREARRFAKLFRLKLGKTAGILPPRARIEALRELSVEWQAGVDARRERREAAHRAQIRANSERLARQIMSGEIEMQRWHDPHLSHNPALEAQWNAYVQKREATAIADWLAGRTSLTRDSWPTMLRLERDPNEDVESGIEVVTSRGARVPAEDAKRAFNFAMKFIKSGREWRRNGEQFHVGHYQLDSITDKGIQAGCHLITWDVVIEFGKKMGWTTCQEKNASLTERSES